MTARSRPSSHRPGADSGTVIAPRPRPPGTNRWSREMTVAPRPGQVARGPCGETGRGAGGAGRRVCFAVPCAQSPSPPGWAAIPDVLAVRALAAAGLDYVVIDLQHGAATEHDLPALTTAIAAAGAAPVARVRHAHPADIGRALDLGCAGAIVPNIESAEQARAAVGACHYPPRGYRSGGGALA